MHNQTLTIPQHADPVARGLLLALLAALLWVALAAPSTPASAAIVVLPTQPLVAPPLAPRLGQLAAQPTALPSPMPTAILTALPTEPPLPAPETALSASEAAQPTTPPPAEPPALVAVGSMVPPGEQHVHQEPGGTYITVGTSALRYYVDVNGSVTEVRLPGADTSAEGADLSVTTPPEPTATPAPQPSSPNGYRPRAGYRPKP